MCLAKFFQIHALVPVDSDHIVIALLIVPDKQILRFSQNDTGVIELDKRTGGNDRSQGLAGRRERL